ETSLPLLIALVISIISGAIITPLLLPYIPFRSFALKGAISGLSLLYLADYIFGIFTKTNPFLKIAIIILGTLFSSYTALQFTGSTPFTSLSGVKKEIRFTLPIYISAIVISIVLLIINKAIQWSLI
ncbi:MAG TPA: mercury methylation corrinoid protein HgcA, partial [Spirochaetota bacterium]|nr:mercury methylation corrinoid protein HgcA [Spirochaetota bacterium]